MDKAIDVMGMRFGRLTVIERANSTPGRNGAYWLCSCDCGKKVVVRGGSLRCGHTKSCGCFHDELSSQRMTEQNITHGLSGTRIYGIWSDMKRRCNDERRFAFDRYGGRGISVCDEWSSFELFYEWAMANGYRDDLTIERTNNNGNYCPQNCTWETMKTQGNNKSNNVKYSYRGGKYTVSQLSDLCGIPRLTLYSRIRNYGWSVEKAVNTPVRRKADGRYFV